ncbi:Heavy metal tolerance protein [Golovinomyces cichoracearum]|uniref:Heavy metal tolerance protein n=1 Tax=Golovinomyces cichoracearum TaxID=62708 RepID=A0A420HA42_9PEZI|nr:Heavy metal tolerance protein [Golovinomyces cichoracearum]
MIHTRLNNLASGVRTTVKFTHYAFPCFVCIFFFTALILNVCMWPMKRQSVNQDHLRKKFVLSWISGITLAYFTESILYGVRGVATGLYSDRDQIVCSIASTITYGTQALVLIESRYPVWYPYLASWVIGFIVELTLLAADIIFYPSITLYDFVIIVGRIMRFFSFILLLLFHICYQKYYLKSWHIDAEQQALLSSNLAQKSFNTEGLYENGYGTYPENSHQNKNGKSDSNTDGFSHSHECEDDSKLGKQSKQAGNWLTYVKGFNAIFPYLWPFKHKSLQLRAALVIICLLGSSALNVLVPRQMGAMVDCLTKYAEGDYSHNIWSTAIIYTFLRFASGGSGISWLRQWLWNPIEQYSYDALNTASHSHIMSLSSDFHDSKTSSDLSQAVLGGRSVTLLLETICFQIVPMSLDLAFAFGYLVSQFGSYMGLILVVTVGSYFYATTKLYAHRAKKRRDYITMFRKEVNIGQESLDGWTTASLFNMIFYEQRRYACAVREHLQSKYTYEISSQLVNMTQGVIMAAGLLAVLWLGIYQVVYDDKSVGQFTTLLIFWAQLSTPLVFFSTIYRSLMNSMMDAERLLELLNTKPTIENLPNAKPLEFNGGLVKFECVSFAYDSRKPTLKNISLTAHPGKSIALVGETGGGKSTILKLLDRFYDVDSGSISIDGQDIRNITLSSLRERIGVVPQDPMLFNDTILNNVRYAKLSATNEEVFGACKAAVIHDKILSFPDGYNSQVGDRGMKLSGGEKQRIAIARVILKRPDILILDEATSAVDTETEQFIQEGLNNLCQGRTTFLVAHRLSTILKADYIYVVMDGEIVEEGSHSSLILENGKYKELWSKQIYSKEHIDRPKSHSSSHTPPYTNTIKTYSVSKLNKKAQGRYSKSNIGSILYKNSECKLDKSENDSTRQGIHHRENSPKGSGRINSSNEDLSSSIPASSGPTEINNRGMKTGVGLSSIKKFSSKIAVRQSPKVQVEKDSKLTKLSSGEVSIRRSLAKTDPLVRGTTSSCERPRKSCEGVSTLSKPHSTLRNIKTIRRHFSNPSVQNQNQDASINRSRRNRQLKLKNRGLDKIPTGTDLPLGREDLCLSEDDEIKSVVEEKRRAPNKSSCTYVPGNDKISN